MARKRHSTAFKSGEGMLASSGSAKKIHTHYPNSSPRSNPSHFVTYVRRCVVEKQKKGEGAGKKATGL